MQRRHRKTLRLSLLPGELAAPDEIERNAYNRQQSPAKFLLGPKLMHPDVVILVEAGERIRIALFVRGAQICANQAVAINRVEQESIRIDRIGHGDAESEESQRERGQDRDRRIQKDV